MASGALALDEMVVSPVAIVARLWRNRELIVQLIRRDVTQRYRGSYLGMVWSVLNPLLMLAVYTTVFSLIFKQTFQKGEPTKQFALTLLAGLTAFNIFAEVVSRSPGLILGVPNYVKRVVFPLDILPITTLGGSIVNSLMSIAVLVVGMLVLMGGIPLTSLLVLAVFVPLIFLSLGFSWFLASLGTYFRDIGQTIPIALQAVQFLSPIFWSISSAPTFLRGYLYFNPMTVIADGFRRTLVWGEPPEWVPLLAWTGVSMVLAWLGYVWFMYTKRGFADVL